MNSVVPLLHQELIHSSDGTKSGIKLHHLALWNVIWQFGPHWRSDKTVAVGVGIVQGAPALIHEVVVPVVKPVHRSFCLVGSRHEDGSPGHTPSRPASRTTVSPGGKAVVHNLTVSIAERVNCHKGPDRAEVGMVAVAFDEV